MEFKLCKHLPHTDRMFCKLLQLEHILGSHSMFMSPQAIQYNNTIQKLLNVR